MGQAILPKQPDLENEHIRPRPTLSMSRRDDGVGGGWGMELWQILEAQGNEIPKQPKYAFVLGPEVALDWGPGCNFSVSWCSETIHALALAPEIGTGSLAPVNYTYHTGTHQQQPCVAVYVSRIMWRAQLYAIRHAWSGLVAHAHAHAQTCITQIYM